MSSEPFALPAVRPAIARSYLFRRDSPMTEIIWTGLVLVCLRRTVIQFVDSSQIKIPADTPPPRIRLLRCPGATWSGLRAPIEWKSWFLLYYPSYPSLKRVAGSLRHSWPGLLAILGLLWLRGGACARFSSGAMDPGQSLSDGSRRLSLRTEPRFWLKAWPRRPFRAKDGLVWFDVLRIAGYSELSKPLPEWLAVLRDTHNWSGSFGLHQRLRRLEIERCDPGFV